MAKSMAWSSLLLHSSGPALGFDRLQSILRNVCFFAMLLRNVRYSKRFSSGSTKQLIGLVVVGEAFGSGIHH